MIKVDGKILTESESREVFGYSDAVLVTSEYVRVDEPCVYDERKRTWLNILRKSMPKTVLGRSPDSGFSYLLILREDGVKALREIGFDVPGGGLSK